MLQARKIHLMQFQLKLCHPGTLLAVHMIEIENLTDSRLLRTAGAF